MEKVYSESENVVRNKDCKSIALVPNVKLTDASYSDVYSNVLDMETSMEYRSIPCRHLVKCMSFSTAFKYLFILHLQYSCSWVLSCSDILPTLSPGNLRLISGCAKNVDKTSIF